MVADDHFFDTFPCRYSLRLLVCYRGHFSVYKTLEKVCIAVSLRLTQNLSQNACTIGRNWGKGELEAVELHLLTYTIEFSVDTICLLSLQLLTKSASVLLSSNSKAATSASISQ